MRAGSPDSQGSPIRNGWSVITQAWFAPIAVLLGVFNLLASYAVLTEDGAKAPGNVIGPIVMTTLAVSIFSGLWLRWRASRSIQQLPAAANPAPGLVSTRMIVALTIVLVVTLALLVVGVAAGSEPMFFIALALIGGTALGCGGRALARALRSSNLADKVSLADGMIIVGTLPAFGLFWMVIPPLMAIAVIIGIAGTGARFRHAA